MPSKTEEYLALAQRTANGLTRYWESWTDYLTTASRLYKYPFADQLMIYAQRPDATACAEFDIWRNRMNRYVRRGAKGIALLDESSGFPRLHYVFDVSDTGVRRNSRAPEVWQYNDDLKQSVSEMLSKNYGISGERVSQQLADVAGKLVADYWDNNGENIRAIVDGSLLMDANILNYLTQERKLSPSLVNFFIAAGDIYEDSSHHNVVFVGRDADGHPRYASSRGIQEKFRQDAAGAEKAFGFAHRGTDKQLLVFEAPIDLLSFIELFPKNWQQHNYLSLGGVSGKALRQFLSERPDVERVFLCLDSDKAGEDACKRLAGLLPDTVSVTRIQPCMKDWNDVLAHRAEIPNRNYFKSIVLKEPSKPETVKIIRMSDVELTPVEWLWKPYLPFGKLSVLQGNPGEGKTYFAMHLAAACTNGKLLPNMERMEPFNVIYQTAEDGLGDTVKPRLIEAGADLDRVLVIDDSDVQLTLSDERIEKAIIENNARLVIIDPIQAYLGADVDMNRANEVRPIFMRLGQVAQRTGCAILLIGHLNKAAGMQSLQRGLGSIDIAAAVRSVMFIGKLKHDPTMRILTHEKSSLAPPGVSLAFSLGDEGGFRWVGEYDITADEMLSGIEPQRETKTQQAKDLICTLLAGGKQVLSEDIDKAALERGIPGRTVRDAKRELGDALKSKIVEGRKKVFWME